MRSVFLAIVLSAGVAATLHAANPELQALLRKMDCVFYRLDNTKQRFRLTAEYAIPDTTTVWALVNEGPSGAVIFASNGDRMSLAVFNGNLFLFSGDPRYSYSIGLGEDGSAIVHLCR